MIAVIADDLTGAAELGGVGLRYGLTSEVQTHSYHTSKAKLIVIDTDTRSASPEDAAGEVGKVVRELEKMAAELVYKKVDSVMRGHILVELEALLSGLGKRRALLVPANPSFGRTIEKGRYLIGGRPLHETDFSHDPEYPATSSMVLDLLGPSVSKNTRVLKPHQSIPDGTIAIGEAGSRDDLASWSAQLDPDVIPAGAADFFAAILESRGFHVKLPRFTPPADATYLYVCGSSSCYSRKAVKEAVNRGLPVSAMPSKLFHARDSRKELVKRWADDTSSLLERFHRAIVAIYHPVASDPGLAHLLCHDTSALVESVLHRSPIDELYVEGGATASAIVRCMGWTRFFPRQELAPGVVRMGIEGEGQMHLTIKPGSYPWPRGAYFGKPY